MERESLLATFIILLSGAVLQLCAAMPDKLDAVSVARRREGLLWLTLWWPAMPALTVVAWLCGWALSQPDPVPNHVGHVIFMGAGPFALIGTRALLRAGWSLCRSPHPYGIVTVGLVWPRVVVALDLARRLDEHELRAAFMHECMHVRHRDPLRIWLAQLMTDLQWPWVPARARFERWLEALELARDDEARAAGVAGADLAAALIHSLRFHRGEVPAATLIGRPQALPVRISRLLRPLPDLAPHVAPPYIAVAGGLVTTWLLAMLLGVCFGERVIGALLALSS